MDSLEASYFSGVTGTMTIYHIAVAKSDRGISGGERCLIELVKYLSGKNVKNVIVTTRIGKEMFEKTGLLEKYRHIGYITADLSEREGALHIFLTWILCAWRGMNLARTIVFKPGDVVMSHSNFFPDFLTTVVCKKAFYSPRVYYWNHLIPPNPFYGYEGEFTGRLQIPRLNVLFFRVNRFVFRTIFLKPEDTIVTVSRYYKRILQRAYRHNPIYAVQYYGGADAYLSYRHRKRYDGVWIGRFHPQKGLFQLLDIVSHVVERRPQFRIIVIGGGDEATKKAFLREIKKRHLEHAICYVGFVLERNRIKTYLRESKVFLMTSTYESFGQVSLEAMKQAVPVVAYDLPPYEPLIDGMITVPILNNKAFAAAVLKLLGEKQYYRKQARRAYAHSKKFYWSSVGKEIYALLNTS